MKCVPDYSGGTVSDFHRVPLLKPDNMYDKFNYQLEPE